MYEELSRTVHGSSTAMFFRILFYGIGVLSALIVVAKWSLSLSHTHGSLFSLTRSTEWVLWEHAGGANKDPNTWKENMKALCEFRTVEGFWQYFNHLPRPSEVFFDGECRKKVGPEGKTVEEYSLFKKGIEPEWGDAENVKGGEWFCRQYFESDVLDLYWQNLVMGIVGDSIDDGS
jgi:hypothetical protein